MNNEDCYQTIRENEERKQYLIKYNDELIQLFTDLLNDHDKNVIISHEIHCIFNSFVDKSVKYFIRNNEMKNPISYKEAEDDDDDDDDDDDVDVDDDDNNNNNNIYKNLKNKKFFNKHK
jgi:hypothetical protein